MILYRPHRGGFREETALAREFDSIEAMMEHIVQEHTDPEMGPALSVEDIVIGEEEKYDSRNGWNTRYVCTKRYYGENYAIPQCIGMRGTIFEQPIPEYSECA